MSTLAPYIDAIPLVATTAERNTKFPTPDTGQRVQNLETGAIERYTGSAWVSTPVTSGTVYVDSYAVGDGSTDDTNAVQAAFDAAVGGEVVFGPKTYKVTDQIEVTRPCVVRGAGRGVTVIRATTLGTGKGVLKVTSSNVTIRDLTVRGPSVASYVLDECAVWFCGTSGAPLTDCVAENVEVYDVGAYGLLFEYANRSRASRNYAHDVGYVGIANLSSADYVATENVVITIAPGTVGNAYGMFVNKRLTGDTTPTRGTMSKNIVRDVAVWEGIDTHGATHYTISGNVVSGCKVGIQVGADSFGNVPHFTVIEGNDIGRGSLTTTQLRGISVGGDGSTNVRGIVIKGNTIDTMGGADGSSGLLGAILIQYTLGSVCVGNHIYNAEQNGIIYDGGGNTGIVCSGNAVHGVVLRTGNASALRFNVATTGVCAGNYLDATDNYPLYFHVACPSLRLDDTNVLITDGTAPASGTTIVGVAHVGRGGVFRGSKTHNFGDLAAGATELTTVTVTGAVLGDKARAWLLIDQAEVILHAYVSAVNTVTVVAQNLDSGNVNLAETTLSAEVIRS